MYGEAAALLGYISTVPAYQEGLYTSEKHLFYLAMETMIYAQRKREGMLDARAFPFYPPMVKDNSGKFSVDKSTLHNNEHNKKNLEKSENNVGHTSTKSDNCIPTTIAEVNKIIEEDWVAVKAANIRTRVVQEAVQKAYIQHLRNRYKALAMDNKEEEVEDTNMKNDTPKEIPSQSDKSHNVNKMTLEEMVKYLQEHQGDIDTIENKDNGDDQDTIWSVNTMEEEVEIEYESDEVESEDSLGLME